MHSVSAPIPIARTDHDNSFGESAELLGFPILQDADAASRPSGDVLQGEVIEVFPVSKVCGERVEASAEIIGGYLYLTNYRIVITENTKCGIAVIPLVGVESVEARDTCGLQITCKYGRVYKVTVLNSEYALEWYKRLSQKTVSARSVCDIFAWQFARPAKTEALWLRFDADSCDTECAAEPEFVRLGYNPDKWRISTANANFKICETYPQEVIVPKAISDKELELGAEARTLSRFPAAVWHCRKNETVLMRSSQPRVGFFSYRYEQDERLVECVRDRSATLLIIDARSYTAALGNRAKGGGVELPDYYKQTELEYMSLPNIHNIRYAFYQLRAVLQNKSDLQYHMSLQSTNWFPYLYQLIDTAFRCVRALEEEGRSVLVHCSDGWDRTTQITTLAKIIADPYYRTFEGFRKLIQRDWIDFGHKFKDRLGVLNKDPNEVSPVFLQWLDCVYQLYRRNPFAFQFSSLFLTQLALHAYSGLFGTFLWNSLCEKKKYQSSIEEAETLSIWSYLHDEDSRFVNFMYNCCVVGRLMPLNGLIDLTLWRELYLCSRFEQIVNEPDSRCAASIINEGLRASLYRSHSAERLSNVDASTSHATHGLNGDKTHLSGVHSCGNSDKDLPSAATGTRAAFSSQSPLEQRFAKLVDISGIPKVDDLFEDIRYFMRTSLQERDNRILAHLEKAKKDEEKIRELEQKLERYTTTDSHFLDISTGDLDFRNGTASSVDDDSENGSVDSNTSFVDRAEVQDIYYGRKGQLMDEATRRCMGCAQDFSFIKGRHHCRSCGGLFCGSCSSFTYHRVQDSKGEQVRACRGCYMKMSPGRYVSSSSQQNTPTQSILVRE